SVVNSSMLWISSGLTMGRSTIHRTKWAAAPRDANGERRWRGPDLNRRHHGFQPCALPTELPRLEFARAGYLTLPRRTGESMDAKQQELWERISDVRPTMMTTVEADGTLRARPMWTQGDSFDGSLW